MVSFSFQMVSLNCHTADEQVTIHRYLIIAQPPSDPSWAKRLGDDWSDPLLWRDRCCGKRRGHRHQHPSPRRRLLWEDDQDAPGILSLFKHHQTLPLSRPWQRRFFGLHPWHQVFDPTKPKQINARFLSMAWVIVGHGYSQFMSGQVFSTNWLVSQNHFHFNFWKWFLRHNSLTRSMALWATELSPLLQTSSSASTRSSSLVIHRIFSNVSLKNCPPTNSQSSRSDICTVYLV